MKISVDYYENILNIVRTLHYRNMINIRHVTKMFGAFKAVDDLTLEIDQGNIFGFLGPNGAGKTTTIKMMTGLFAPNSGTISINGFDIQKNPLEAKAAVGYIPDQPFLYEKLTGREFLYFSAGLYRVGHEKSTERIKKLADLFEIGSWIDQRTESYSQGMRQRLIIVSALLHDPKVIIVDELLVGLDPRSARIAKETLKNKSKEGAAVFMSTHSLPVVEELCDRIAIIKEGRLIYEGLPGDFNQMKDKYDGKFESLFLELTK